MKALSIPQPHAEAIMRGIKSVEFRTRPTGVRGRIYIHASLNRYHVEEEAEMLAKVGIGDVNADDLARGVLLGTVELWNCTGSDGKYEWHLCSPERAAELLKPTKRSTTIWFNPL